MSAGATDTVVKGVPCISRHNVAAELAVMREWVWALPPFLRELVREVFCDSNAEFLFEIRCRDGSPGQWCEWYAILPEALDRVCMMRHGGHNGISVVNPTGELLFDVGANWADDPLLAGR